MRHSAVLVWFCLAAAATNARPASASGDFPLASCKSWDGTITERSGIDGRKAVLIGSVTAADLREYCIREPGDETKPDGSKLTTDECVAQLMKSDGNSPVSAEADCATGLLVSHDGDRPTRTRFPLRRGADTSCGSGLPPLMSQFKILCPKAAKRMRLD